MAIDPTIVERVLACVDERAIVALASDLIRIPSFKPDETPVAAFLSDFFRERGHRTDVQEVEPGRLQTIATLPGPAVGRAWC